MSLPALVSNDGTPFVGAEDAALRKEASGANDNVLKRSLRGGFYGAGSQLMSAGAGLADAIGADQLGTGLHTGSRSLRAEAALPGNAPRVGSYDQLSKDFSLDNLGEYVGGLVGGSLPVTAAGIAGGIATGGAGFVPAALGAAGATLPFHMGEVVQSQQDDPQAMQQSAGQRFGNQLLGGAGAAAIEGLVPGLVGRQVLGKGVANLGKESIKQIIGRNALDIPLEGFTEGAGTAVKGYAANQDKPTDWNQIKEAAIGGAAAGSVFTGVGTAADLAHSVGPTAGNALSSALTSTKDRIASAKSAAEGKLDAAGDSAAGKKVKGAWDSFTETMGRGKTKVDDTLDRMMGDKPLGATDDEVAKSSPERLAEILAESTRQGAAKAKEFGEEMLSKMVDGDPRRQAVVDAMAKGGERAGVATMAALKKGWDLAQQAGAKIDDLAHAVNNNYEATKKARQNADVEGEVNVVDDAPESSPGGDWPQVGYTEQAPHDEAAAEPQDPGAKIKARKAFIDARTAEGMTRRDASNEWEKRAAEPKKSEDYSGAQRMVLDVLETSGLRQKSPELFADNKSVNTLADTLRQLVGNMARGPLDSEQIGAAISVLGESTASVMSSIRSSLEADGADPAKTEHFFRNLNEIDAIQKRSNGLYDTMRWAFTDDAKTTDLPANIERDAKLLVAHARGEFSAKAGAKPSAQEAFMNTQVNDFYTRAFGDKADAVRAAVEAEAAAGQGKGAEERVRVDDTGNEVVASEGGFDESGDRLQAAEQEIMKFGLSKPDARGNSKSALNGAAMEADSRYARQHLKDLKAEYPEHDVRFEHLPGSDFGHIVVEKRDNPNEFNDEDLARMKLETKAHSASVSRIEFKGHIIDAVKVAQVMRKKMDQRPGGGSAAAMTQEQRLADAFKQGIAQLVEQTGTEGLSIPGGTVIGYIGRKPLTWDAAKKLDVRTDEDKVRDTNARGQERLRDALREANVDVTNAGVTKDVEAITKAVEKAQAIKKELAELVKEHNGVLNAELARGDDIQGRSAAPRAKSKSLLQRAMTPKDPGASGTTLTDNGESLDTTRPMGASKDGNIHEDASRNSAEKLIHRANMDGSPHWVDSHGVEGLNTLSRVIAEHWSQVDSVPAKRIADRARTLVQSAALMSAEDVARLKSLAPDPVPGVRNVPAASVSDAAPIINSLARKYKDTIMGAVGEALSPETTAADGGAGGKNTFTALSPKYREASAQAELLPLQPDADRNLTSPVAGSVPSYQSAEEKQQAKDALMRDPKARMHREPISAAPALVIDPGGKGSVAPAGAPARAKAGTPQPKNPVNFVGSRKARAAPAAAPKAEAPKPAILSAAIAKRQDYVDNPPASYSADVVRGTIDWATTQKERVDAEYAKVKDGDDHNRIDQLSDYRFALQRLITDAKASLQNGKDARAAGLYEEGSPDPKAVAAKKAAFIARAASGDVALLAELSTSNDAKGLQRAAAVLPAGDALGAINARLAELVQNPDVAYGLGTKRYSLESGEETTDGQARLITRLADARRGEFADANEAEVFIRSEGTVSFGPVQGGTKFFFSDSRSTHVFIIAAQHLDAVRHNLAVKPLERHADVLAYFAVQHAFLDRADGTFQSFSALPSSPTGKWLDSIGAAEATGEFFGDGTTPINRVLGVTSRQTADFLADALAYTKKIEGNDKVYVDWTRITGAKKGKRGSGMFSAEATNPTRNNTSQQYPGIKAYIEKTLGKSVRLAWAKFAHAGEFQEVNGQAGIMGVIRLSVHALDPLSTAYHESLHAFIAQLNAGGNKDISAVLLKAASAPHVVAQLNKMYASQPAVLRQLLDPEERAAYMYQAWAAKTLTVGPQTRTVFERIAALVRSVLGIWSNDQRALHIFEHFNSGEYAKAMGTPSANRAAMMASGTNQTIEYLKPMVEPLGRLADAMVSTGDDRLRDTNIPALIALADKIKRRGTTGGGDQGFIPAARIAASKRLSAMAKAMESYSHDDLTDALEALQSGKPATTPRGQAAAVEIKAVLKETKTYMERAGVKLGDLGPDYFPRVWDTHFISKNEQALRDMLEPYVRSGEFKGDVTDFIRSLSSHDGGDDEGIVTNIPGMQHTKTRDLAFLKPADVAPFLKKDLMGTMTSYINQATRRAEWERRLGWDDATGDTVRNDLLRQARGEGATPEQIATAEQYLRGVDGTLGDDINPHARRLMGDILVYQNVRLLPMAIFSMAVDPVGVMVRGGTVAEAFATFKRGIASLPATFRKGAAAQDEATRLAELVGVVDAAVLSHVMGDLYTQGMVGGFAEKVNHTFFKYNMVEGLNRAFRVGASEAAMSFIARHASLMNSRTSRHSRRWIEELGLVRGDVVKLPSGRIALTQAEGLTAAQERRVHAAVNQWVDGAMLRPDAADRPIWMSDPRFALVSHMKQFVFSFQKTILARIMHEMRFGNYSPAMALAAYVPVMIASDTLKGVIQNGGDEPAWKKGWGVPEYVGYGMQRAGLFGVGQFGLDAAEDVGRGGVGIGALSGPTIEQMADGVQALGGNKQFAPFLLRSMPANALYKDVFSGAAEPEKEAAAG